MDTTHAEMVATDSVLYNTRNKMDGAVLLRSIEAGAAALVIADFQYRGILDKMKYGNEGKRQIGRARLSQMSEETILDFMEQSGRVLRPSGHIFLWSDKFQVGEGRHVEQCKASGAKIVDILTWNKGRIGMGSRSRATCEYLVVAQKPPLKARGVWKDRGISDCWYEHPRRSRHPHEKPHNMTTRLLECVTNPGDLVVDPCSGSYLTLDICRATGRIFLGCDIAGQ